MNKLFISLRKFTSRRRGKLAVWALGFLLVYTIFGFLVLPWIVKHVAVKQISKLLDRETSIRQVRINPFVLSGTVRGLLVKDKDGQPFLSVEEAYANFQLSSLFGNAWVFKEVWTIKPFCRVQINQDFTLNFSDLATKFSKPAGPAKPPGKPFNLHISRLQITGASAAFSDLTPSTPFHRLIGPLQITLTSFHTDPNNRNPYSFSGTTDSGEKFSWTGQFSLAPFQSAGELNLEGLSIAKYAPLFQDAVRFEIKDGILDGHASYRFALTGSNYFAAITNSGCSLTSLKVAEPGSTENLVELDRFGFSGVSADTALRTAEVAEVSMAGGRISVKRNKDESINLIQISEPPAQTTNASGGLLFLMSAATNAFAALIQSTNFWTGTIHQVQVTNCALQWEDLAASSPVRCSVEEFALSAHHLSNVAGSNQTAGLSFRWNTNGFVTMDSTVQISPPSGALSLNVSNVELQVLDPYLKPFLNVFLLGSRLGVAGDFRMRIGTNDLPDVTFRGNARLDDFATVDAQTQDLVKWKSVQLSGLDASLQPPAVAIKEIGISDLYARVAFDTNQTLNFLSVVKTTGTNSTQIETTNVALSTPLPVARSAKKSGLGQRLGGILEKILAPATNGSGEASAPKIAVENISITNGFVQFNDASVQPPVSISVQELNGTVSHISSDELKRADLHITGKADRTGPIEITGTINPLSPTAETKLQILFRDVDLSPTSPYSGKFLGYRLNRGRLGIQVTYEVSRRKLKARNVVVIDGLTLGEKVASPDATSLPVKLAVALLKDRNGKIEIDLPIEGDLDDPKFHFGKVVTHVLVNVMTKIVTSPFAALGALFGGKGEEVSYQDFAPGSSEVTAANLAKLDSLVKGLGERPSLELQVEGSFEPGIDTEGLRKRKLRTEFREKKWKSLSKGERNRTTAQQVSLTPKEYQTFLRSAYAAAARTNSSWKLSESGASTNRVNDGGQKPDSDSSTTEKGAKKLLGKLLARPAPTPDERETALGSLMTVTEDDLKRLASERASVVRQKILDTGKIDAARVVVAEPSETSSTNHAARVFFHLQ